MTLEALKKNIDIDMGVLIYFSGETCNVCHTLRPKFKELFDNEFPLIKQVYLDAHENAEISAHFGVFSVPTMLVFLDGKEFIREGRAVSLHKLQEQLMRPYTLITE